MLRAFVLLLMLLNLAYLAWGQGWLLPYGMGPMTQREPQRLAQQLHPEAIRMVRPGEVAAPQSDGKDSDVACLQSERLDADLAGKLRALLQEALPAASWTIDELSSPPRWIVYMGKYANDAEVDKKRAELARLQVTGEAPRNPALNPGLALGGFDFQAQADAALKVLAARGVRTAHVVQDLPPSQGFRLRLPVVNAALKAQLPGVQTALPTLVLQPCGAAPGAN